MSREGGGSVDDRLLLQAFHLRGPRNGPRTPPDGGRPFSSSGSSAAGAPKWPPHSPHGGRPFSSSGSSAAGAPKWPPHSPHGGQPVPSPTAGHSLPSSPP